MSAVSPESDRDCCKNTPPPSDAAAVVVAVDASLAAGVKDEMWEKGALFSSVIKLTVAEILVRSSGRVRDRNCFTRAATLVGRMGPMMSNVSTNPDEMLLLPLLLTCLILKGVSVDPAKATGDRMVGGTPANRPVFADAIFVTCSYNRFAKDWTSVPQIMMSEVSCDPINANFPFDAFILFAFA